MILVPRQLQRSGMTGGVPYYGGRLTPAQAWGATHRQTPQSAASPREPRPTRSTPAPGEEQAASAAETSASALRSLRESGVLTAEEYDELRGRIQP